MKLCVHLVVNDIATEVERFDLVPILVLRMGKEMCECAEGLEADRVR